MKGGNMLTKLYDRFVKALDIHFYKQELIERDGDTIIEDIQPHRQLMSYNCGMACLLTVGCLLNKKDVDRLLSDENGVNYKVLVRYLKKNQMGYLLKDAMSFDDVVKCVDNGFCIITTTNHSGGHWCVIYGYYENGVIVAGCSKMRYSWDEFSDKYQGCQEENIIINSY